MTQKEIILRVCKDREYHQGYTLMRQETIWGFLGKNGDRRARELTEEKLLLPDYDDNGQVRYRITEAGLRHLAEGDKKSQNIRERVKDMVLQSKLAEHNRLGGSNGSAE